MNAHENARTTPHIRELMADRFASSWEASEIAEAVGVTVQTVYKWIGRHREGGFASLQNASSAPRHVANRLSESTISRIVRLRRERRLTGAAIASQLGLKRSTVAGWLTRLGLGRLKSLEEKPPVVRYERERAGDLVHIDIKKLGRFNKVGHRITGDRTKGRSGGAGWDHVHVAVDDATRTAYVEILPDESKESVTDFFKRTRRWLARRGVCVEEVMTDNGGGYRSHLFAEALDAADVRHIRTRPYTPRTNGKAERFIQTLLREWAYARSYPTSGRRNATLRAFVEHYNQRRPHASLAGKPPAYAFRLKR